MLCVCSCPNTVAHILGDHTSTPTVSFHNFKSQNVTFSVSNPKHKYVVDLSVLSQISNCQSLGRKNKHDFLKTDRADVLLSCLRHR